jgi:hypothetical protein
MLDGSEGTGERILVLDLETVPDLRAVRRLTGVSEENREAALASFTEYFTQRGCANGFAPWLFHKIVAVGLVEARIDHDAGGWQSLQIESAEALTWRDNGEAGLLETIAMRLAHRPTLTT